MKEFFSQDMAIQRWDGAEKELIQSQKKYKALEVAYDDLKDVLETVSIGFPVLVDHCNSFIIQRLEMKHLRNLLKLLPRPTSRVSVVFLKL